MKNRGFWYLFGAQAVSSFGDFFGLIALEWMFYDLTGSKSAMGMLAFAFGLSEMVSRFALSPLIDRMNRIRLMAALDFIRFAGYGLFALNVAFGGGQSWPFYVLAIVIGSCNGLFAPASMAVLPSLMSQDKLVRGYSLMDASFTLSVLIGPSLAAFTVSWAGPLWSVGIDAVSFMLSGFFIYLLSRHAPVSTLPGRSAGGLRTYIAEMLDGVRFYRYAPALLFIQCFAAVRNMCSVAAMSLIIPYGVEHLHIDVQGIGLLTTAGSIGGIAGTMFVAWIGDVQIRRIPMLASMAGSGLALIGLAFAQQYWAACVLLVLFGFSGPMYGTFSSTLYARLVPERLRGRVQSARLLVGGSLQPVGSSVGGLFGQAFGLPALFLAAGAMPVAGAIAGWFIRPMKGIDGELAEIDIPNRSIGISSHRPNMIQW